jgi:small-conductance mechanosensitive channel
MPNWQEIWQIPLLWNTVGDWTRALLAFLVTFTVLPLIKGYISSRRRKWIQSGRELPTAIDVASLLVDRTSRLFLWTVAVYLALTQVELPRNIERAVSIAIVLTFWFQVGLWAMSGIRHAFNRRRTRTGAADPAFTGSIDIILFVAGLVVWTMAFLLALDNLGVEIKPLLAGLGITGIAVALAVQTVLGDLLASLSIALDKPFTLGDFLTIDDVQGSVEHIGVKSTRLRSLSGEQIIMSNADILKSRVRNFGRMRQRRAVFTFGVTYDTPVEKLRELPRVVREIVEAQPKVRFDRCHLLSYADWSLRYEVVYIVEDADFNLYADIQQSVNLAILERFQEMDVSFAFPSRPVWMQTPPQPAEAK